MMNFTNKQIHILDVAEELIALKGFDKTSIREISAKANVNVAMISYYFGSKEKMMACLYLHRVEKIKRLLSSYIEGVSSEKSDVQITMIIDFFISQLFKYNYFHGFVTQELKYTQEVKDILLDFYQSLVHALDTLIQKGIREGVFSKVVDSENILTTLIGSVIFIVRNQNFYKIYLDSKEDDFLFEAEKKLKNYLKESVFCLLGYLPKP